jgi:hypothetical protein
MLHFKRRPRLRSTACLNCPELRDQAQKPKGLYFADVQYAELAKKPQLHPTIGTCGATSA